MLATFPDGVSRCPDYEPTEEEKQPSTLLDPSKFLYTVILSPIQLEPEDSEAEDLEQEKNQHLRTLAPLLLTSYRIKIARISRTT
jgi:hypothetical protein